MEKIWGVSPLPFLFWGSSPAVPSTDPAKRPLFGVLGSLGSLVSMAQFPSLALVLGVLTTPTATSPGVLHRHH